MCVQGCLQELTSWERIRGGTDTLYTGKPWGKTSSFSVFFGAHSPSTPAGDSPVCVLLYCPFGGTDTNE